MLLASWSWSHGGAEHVWTWGLFIALGLVALGAVWSSRLCGADGWVLFGDFVMQGAACSWVLCGVAYCVVWESHASGCCVVLSACGPGGVWCRCSVVLCSCVGLRHFVLVYSHDAGICQVLGFVCFWGVTAWCWELCGTADCTVHWAVFCHAAEWSWELCAAGDSIVLMAVWQLWSVYCWLSLWQGGGLCAAKCCVMLGLCDVGGCDVLFSSVFLCVAEESCAGGVLWC